jgi:hypothetical protein
LLLELFQDQINVSPRDNFQSPLTLKKFSALTGKFLCTAQSALHTYTTSRTAKSKKSVLHTLLMRAAL